MKPRLLSLGILCLAINAHSQLQIGHHYNIRTNYAIHYLRSDTVRDATKKITQIDNHFYVTGGAGKLNDLDNSSTPALPVTNHYYAPLVLCGSKLKAGLSQVDGDKSGKVYIDFWGIDATKEAAACRVAGVINTTTALGQFYYQVNIQQVVGDARNYIPVSYGVTEIGVATVPFKFRGGFTKDGVAVPSDASASINLGVYLARKWGTTRYYVDKARTKNIFSFSLGGFLSPTVISITPENTFPSTDPVRVKQIAAKSNQTGLSGGLLAVTSFSDFNIGFFYGIDWGLSSLASDWYYHARPWFGIGIGYKLSMLGEK